LIRLPGSTAAEVLVEAPAAEERARIGRFGGIAGVPDAGANSGRAAARMEIAVSTIPGRAAWLEAGTGMSEVDVEAVAEHGGAAAVLVPE
jgi:hypothetical protein